MTKHPICSKHLIFGVKEQISLPWGITGKPWSLLFVPCLWHYSSSLRICLWALTWAWGCCWAVGCVCCSKRCFTCLQQRKWQQPMFGPTDHLAGPCCQKGNHRIKAAKTTCFTENSADAGSWCCQPSAASTIPAVANSPVACFPFLKLRWVSCLQSCLVSKKGGNQP